MIWESPITKVKYSILNPTSIVWTNSSSISFAILSQKFLEEEKKKGMERQKRNIRKNKLTEPYKMLSLLQQSKKCAMSVCKFKYHCGRWANQVCYLVKLGGHQVSTVIVTGVVSSSKVDM